MTLLLLGAAARLGPTLGPGPLGVLAVPLSFPSIAPATLLALAGVRGPFVDLSGDLPFLTDLSMVAIYLIPGIALMAYGASKKLPRNPSKP